MHTLRAKNLQKNYRAKRVVHDLSISVSSGQVAGLLGPNGAGKTTCFYMISGSLRQDRGTIMLDAQDISNEPMHERARAGIGYLPQEASIFRKLSVSENILAILETRQDLSAKERNIKLELLLNDFNISSIRDNNGMSLSGGERRRVEIARALATEPHFILLDEPFAGVDPISVNDIKRIIRQLTERNIGILITDHNVRETLDICDSAYIVNEGRIIFEGSPKEVLNNDLVKQIYLGEDFRM
ncbi:MAG: LPS export ABC transporter ATP-binding protein [Gammaproteobacteria bacterium TMED1]|nr:MAG: LPS export ABC transporter ATP-binding protein [Gammaproteobacteria bacterium TMED1]|tara:strand:- start:7628 stop:8353 length:726 start_codon:yes stop_codon:yes gene_type:complete